MLAKALCFTCRVKESIEVVCVEKNKILFYSIIKLDLVKVKDPTISL